MRGDRIREIREKLGWSQRELARHCGLGENQIHRYEADKVDPHAEHVKMIAGKLGVSADYLLGLTSNPQGQLGDSDLTEDERDILEAFRRNGWIGALRLITERLAGIVAKSS